VAVNLVERIRPTSSGSADDRTERIVRASLPRGGNKFVG
jgi:hypothetical protein